MLVRAATLEAPMSQYLVDAHPAPPPNIEVRLRTEVVAAAATGHLESLTLADRSTGARRRCRPSWLFVFIGASPRTDWLGGRRRPRRPGLRGHRPRPARSRDARRRWPLSRPPFALETSVPGVFAAGDVRLDSMKRVASAVGEGAMSVYLVHRYLATV